MRDNMPRFWGQLTTRVIDAKTGEVLEVDEGPNVVVNMSALIIMDLLAQTAFDALLDPPEQAVLNIDAEHPADIARGFTLSVEAVGDPQTNAIRYIQVGTDGTDAIKTQTALVSPVAGMDGLARITDITFPTNNSVTFVALLGTDQANGSTLREAALLTRGDSADPVTDPLSGLSAPRVMSRRTNADKAKHDGIQLEYSWTLSFA